MWGLFVLWVGLAPYVFYMIKAKWSTCCPTDRNSWKDNPQRLSCAPRSEPPISTKKTAALLSAVLLPRVPFVRADRDSNWSILAT